MRCLNFLLKSTFLKLLFYQRTVYSNKAELFSNLKNTICIHYKKKILYQIITDHNEKQMIKIKTKFFYCFCSIIFCCFSGNFLILSFKNFLSFPAKNCCKCLFIIFQQTEFFSLREFSLDYIK